MKKKRWYIPPKKGTQVHSGPARVLLHVAPFWHGELAHQSISFSHRVPLYPWRHSHPPVKDSSSWLNVCIHSAPFSQSRYAQGPLNWQRSPEKVMQRLLDENEVQNTGSQRGHFPIIINYFCWRLQNEHKMMMCWANEKKKEKHPKNNTIKGFKTNDNEWGVKVWKKPLADQWNDYKV